MRTITTAEAVLIGVPRWMVLAMPEDVSQEVALAALLGRTPAQRRDALRYRLRELRRTQWERQPRKPASIPVVLCPSHQERMRRGVERTARAVAAKQSRMERAAARAAKAAHAKATRITGYRTDSAAHREARLTVNAETRRAIARKGAEKRWRS